MKRTLEYMDSAYTEAFSKERHTQTSSLLILPKDMLLVILGELFVWPTLPAKPKRKGCLQMAREQFHLFGLRRVCSQFLLLIDDYVRVPLPYLTTMLAMYKPVNFHYWTARLQATVSDHEALYAVLSAYFCRLAPNTIVDTVAWMDTDGSVMRELFVKELGTRSTTKNSILRQESLCIDWIEKHSIDGFLRHRIILKAAYFGCSQLLRYLLVGEDLDARYRGTTTTKHTLRECALYQACEGGHGNVLLLVTDNLQHIPPVNIARKTNWVNSAAAYPELFLMLLPHLPQEVRREQYTENCIVRVCILLDPIDCIDGENKKAAFKKLWSLLTLKEARRCVSQGLWLHCRKGQAHAEKVLAYLLFVMNAPWFQRYAVFYSMEPNMHAQVRQAVLQWIPRAPGHEAFCAQLAHVIWTRFVAAAEAYATLRKQLGKAAEEPGEAPANTLLE